MENTNEQVFYEWQNNSVMFNFFYISFSSVVAMDTIQPITTQDDAANVFNTIWNTINRGDISTAQSSLEQFKRMSVDAPDIIREDANEYIKHLDDALFLKTMNLSRNPGILYEKAIAALGKGHTGIALIIIDQLEKLKNQRPNDIGLVTMVQQLQDEYDGETIGGESV